MEKLGLSKIQDEIDFHCQFAGIKFPSIWEKCDSQSANVWDFSTKWSPAPNHNL